MKQALIFLSVFSLVQLAVLVAGFFWARRRVNLALECVHDRLDEHNHTYAEHTGMYLE